MSLLIQKRDFGGVAEAVTIGIQRGEAMLAWWNSFPSITLLDLPESRPDAHMQGFFSTIPIYGVPTGISGCLQTARFKRNAQPGQPAVSLAEWMSTNFLQRCRWKNKDGSRGGFLYRPVLVLDKGDPAEVRRVDEALELQLHEVGSRYAWAVVRLDVLDYMKAFPVVGDYSQYLEWLNREAGYMVLHPNFFHSKHPRPAGCVEEYCFGYSVAPWKVMPTIAAYGAGRFHSAFKQFRFFLMEDGTVSIQVLFLVAPRCQQVLDILGIDPVLGMPRLLDAMTLWTMNLLEFAKSAVDHYAIGHHARIHNSLLHDMREIWEKTNWQPPASGGQISRIQNRIEDEP